MQSGNKETNADKSTWHLVKSYLFKCYKCDQRWNVMAFNPVTNECSDEPQCLKCLNEDGNVWKKTSFLTAFYSNITYVEYASYKNVREMQTIYYSKMHPDKNKKNICVFRINSESEVAVAKLFLSKLKPNRDNPMKGVGDYNQGFYNTLETICGDSCELYFTFLLQIVGSETNLTKLISDNFEPYAWAFCLISTVNIRSLINADEYRIYDIYVE